MIGAVGSVLGLLVIPILEKKLSNRTICRISLGMAILGYALMFIFGPVFKITIALDISYIIASIGIGSMFVAQTVFLADIVDYGGIQNRKTKRKHNLFNERLSSENGIHNSNNFPFSADLEL